MVAPGGQRDGDFRRRSDGVAYNHVSFSGATMVRMGADSATCDAGLYHGLCLYRPAAIYGTGANLAARTHRMAGARILVSRDSFGQWRNRDAGPGAVSVCLFAGARGVS